MREILVEHVGDEAGLESFRRDFEWISGVRRSVAQPSRGSESRLRPEDGLAAIRIWRPAEPRISAGRFHRIAEGTERIQRRLSGGRMLGLGPGVMGLTLFAPSVAWLDPRVERLKPEQVLNRALRPLLVTLRALGLDAFYPGRDVVSVGGRPIVYASFTTLPDGVLVVEMFLALTESFASTPALLARWDSDGVAAVDPASFSDAVCFGDLGGAPEDVRLTEMLANASCEAFDAKVAVAVSIAESSRRATGPAWSAFQNERGPIAPAAASAAGMTMLGIVEVDARILDGKFRSVNICGDVIAPFATLAAISQMLENQPATDFTIRRTLVSVLGNPEHFVLGAPELEGILGRLS